MPTIFNVFCRRSIHTSLVRYRRPRIQGPSASTDQEGSGSYKIFRNLAVLIFIPIIAVLTANAYVSKQKEVERPPFVKYEYLRRRTKRFPWGDGEKSLFHNPRTNALPDGYEYELCEEEETCDGGGNAE